MKKIHLPILPLLLTASLAKAAVVSFDGGIATTVQGEQLEVNNNNQIQNVSYYQEGTVLLSYNLTNPDQESSWQTVGDYYGVQDSVIHGHWTELDSIQIERENNVPFDLQYFQITSNTSVGGGAATDTENIAIQGFLNGQPVTQLLGLPSVDWGANEIQDVFLPDSFNNVDRVLITDLGTLGVHTGGSDCPTCNSAFCFGMDNFVFDEVVPEELIQGNSTTLTNIPEMSVGLMGSLSILLLLQRRKFYR